MKCIRRLKASLDTMEVNFDPVKRVLIFTAGGQSSSCVVSTESEQRGRGGVESLGDFCPGNGVV